MSEFLDFAKFLLQESAKVIKQYFRVPLRIESKADDSPVTIADKKTEELLRSLIQKRYPDHNITGEEFGNDLIESDYQWILDPIDGTRSFICGTPLFGTLIGLLKNGTPIMGAMGLPILGEILLSDSTTTTLNDLPVHMRSCTKLAKATLLTTDYMSIKKYKDINSYNTLMEKVALSRTWGDCYGYYLLATGYADIMIDPILSPWDILPIIPLIRGAGGKITDYNGNNPETGSDLIAANSFLHNKILSIMQTIQ